MDEMHASVSHPDTRPVRDELRERFLAVATMDRTLRIATAVTFCGLIVAAASIAAREVKAPPVSLGVVDTTQVTLSAPLFGIALALLCCGFGYVVAAVMLATRTVAAVGVVLLVALIGWATGVLGFGGLNTVLPAWAQWFTRGLLLAILLGAFVVIAIRRGRHGDATGDRRLRLVVLIAACLLFGSYFFVLWAASPVLNGLTLFPQTVSLLMTDVAILATPLLMIAAIDFGEWGKFGARRLTRLRMKRDRTSGSPQRTYTGSVILCAVALVFGFAILRGSVGDRFWAFCSALVLLTAAVAILVVGGRALRVSRFEWPKALNFVAIFGVCAIITWVIAPATGAAIGTFAVPPTPPVTVHGDYTATANVRSDRGITGFSALVPAGWGVTADKIDRIDTVSNVYPTGLKVVLSGLLAPIGTTMQDMDRAIHLTQVGAVASDHGWTKASVRPRSGGSGVVWLRTETGGPVRVFYGVAVGPRAPMALTQLEAIVRTVRTGDQAPATLAAVLARNGGLAGDERATQRRADVLQSLAVGTELALTILALALFAIFGRRWSAAWRTAVIFFAGVTTITLVATVNALGRVFSGPAAAWPVMTVGGVLAAAGTLGACALVIGLRSRAAWARRLPNALPGILGAIIALAAVNELYDVALGASSVPAWAAILILVAVGWDIITSGESITNLSSATFPRSTRVLAYFGYVLLLAAAMVFYSGQVSSATGHPVTDVFFEPEAITQSALFRIGLPLLLVLFLLRFAASGRLAAASEPGEPSEPSTDEVSISEIEHFAV